MLITSILHYIKRTVSMQWSIVFYIGQLLSCIYTSHAALAENRGQATSIMCVQYITVYSGTIYRCVLMLVLDIYNVWPK